MRRLFLIVSLLMLLPAVSGAAPVSQKGTTPDFKKSGYQVPPTQVTTPTPVWRAYADVGVLTATLALSAWLIYTKRTRTGTFLVMVFSLIYFGFIRKGCVCPIGSVQNVALAIGPSGYALPWTVAAFFILPLAFALFFGRVFCASVCPLGAIQDLFLWKPIDVPNWLEHALGLFPWFYLGLGVMVAYAGSDFVICEYDPFVGFFRLGGPTWMLFLGGVLLVLSMFVGRTYCRFICPYSVLLRLASLVSSKSVSITPKDCINCRLCEKSCPFGAIRLPTPPTTARPVANEREFLGSLGLAPVLIVAFAGLGFLLARPLSHIDYSVRLANQIYLEDKAGTPGLTDETAAFRKDTAQSKDKLYQKVVTIQSRYRKGATILGGWMGLVLGAKLINLAIRRRRSGYTADPAGCVACARCYDSCPVEHDHRRVAGEVVTV